MGSGRLLPADHARSSEAQAEFAAVDRRLREILEPYRSRLVATTTDGPDGLALEIPQELEGKPWGYVAGIRRGKPPPISFSCRSTAGPLSWTGSRRAAPRMQGKACFNF